jgi:hypothetical protein
MEDKNEKIIVELKFCSESYCNMHIPNLIRGRKVNHSFLSLLPSFGQ